jgi:hypothetical protein
VESLRARNSGHVQSVGRHNPHVDDSIPATDVVYTLASKLLHTPLFTAIKWSSSTIQPSKVFHLADRILEGKAPPASLIVAQAIVDTVCRGVLLMCDLLYFSVVY